MFRLAAGGIDHELDRFVPESLRPYVKVDAEAFARDLELGGDVHAIDNPDGKVWLFRA